MKAKAKATAASQEKKSGGYCVDEKFRPSSLPNLTSFRSSYKQSNTTQRRGIKVYGGQPVKAGGIIVRQLGTKVNRNCLKMSNDNRAAKENRELKFDFSRRAFIVPGCPFLLSLHAFGCARACLMSIRQRNEKKLRKRAITRAISILLSFETRAVGAFFLSSSTSTSSSCSPLLPSLLHLPPRPKPTNQQFHPGTDVGRGTDDTLFALSEGIVVFKVTKHERSVSVVPVDKFVVPEGQRRAEVSRRTKRLAQYTPRAAQREALAAAAAAVAVPASP